MKVNGKNIEINPQTKITISEYLESIKIKPETVAIEWNGEILERDKWATTYIFENCRMEIIKFVGGG